MKNTFLLSFVFLAGFVTTGYALEVDPAGKPNEDVYEIIEKLRAREIPISERVEYFAHNNPAIRLEASKSVMLEGEKSIPLIIESLQSDNKRVIRAACDALTGPHGIAVRRKELRAAMTPEIAAKAVPQLLPLLDHKDLYVHEGALLALSNCGKAAAPSLPKVVKLLGEKEWWLRNAAQKVIWGVGSPEADPYTIDIAQDLLAERDIYCLNQMTAALTHLMKTADTQDKVAKILGDGISDVEGPYQQFRPLSVLIGMGPKAKAALPGLNAAIKEKEDWIAKESKVQTEKQLHWHNWSLDNMKKAKAAIEAPLAKPGKKPRK